MCPCNVLATLLNLIDLVMPTQLSQDLHVLNFLLGKKVILFCFDTNNIFCKKVHAKSHDTI